MESLGSIVTGALCLIGGVIGTKLVENYLALRSGAYAIDKQKRRDVLDEHKELIADLQQDNRDLRAREEVRDRQHAECEARYARAETRIEALEDALTAAGIRFRPWVTGGPGPGSGVHTASKAPPPNPPAPKDGPLS